MRLIPARRALRAARRGLLPLSAALLVAACLPSRDNGADPAIAPRAVLSFSDGGEAGNCIPATAIATDDSILDIERGRCLALVGRKSFDPQDDLASLDFQFDLVTGSGAGASLGGGTGADTIVLDADAVRGLPVDSIVTIRLTVRDRQGHENSAESPIVVHDLPPIPPSIPPRTVAVGGPPWNPGASYILPLDAGGLVDPDGDSLQSICWDRPEGTVCSTAPPGGSADPSDPAFLLTVPPTRGRVIATLRASDGVTDTVLGRAVVNVRELPTWGGSSIFAGQGGVALLETSRRFLPLPSSAGATLARVPDTTGATAFVLTMTPNGGTYDLGTRSWPDFAVQSAVTLPGSVGLASPVVGVDGTQAWVVANVGNASVSVYPYSIAQNGTLTPQPTPTPVPLDTEGGFGTNALGAADALGDLFVTQTRSTVVELSPAGQEIGRFADVASHTRVLSLHARPGSDEMWFLRTPDSNSVGGPVSIQRIANGIETSYDLGTGHSFDFAWIDGDSFCVGLDDRLSLVSADALVAGSPFAVAEIRHVPVPAAFRIYPDPRTGEVWALSLATFAYSRVSPEGKIVATGSLDDLNSLLQFVDEAGGCWRYDATNQGAVVDDTPFSEPLASPRVPLTPRGGSNDGTGGVWVSAGGLVTPSAIYHLAEDGSILFAGSLAVDSSGAPTPLPNSIDTFRVVPGATTAWMISHDLNAPVYPPFDVVSTLDLSTTPPVLRTVLGTDAAVKFTANVLEPSAPIPASTPFLWTIEGDPGAIGRLTPSGVFTPDPAGALVGNEKNDVHAVRSLRSNGLCMASFTSGSNIYRSTWFPSSGAAVPLTGNITEPASSSVTAVAVSPDTNGTGDVCWSVIQLPNSGSCSFGTSTLVGFSSTGSLVAAYSVSPPGNIKDIKPVDRNHVWLTVTRCDSASQQKDDLEFLVNTGSLTRVAVFTALGIESFYDDEVAATPFLFPTP